MSSKYDVKIGVVFQFYWRNNQIKYTKSLMLKTRNSNTTYIYTSVFNEKHKNFQNWISLRLNLSQGKSHVYAFFKKAKIVTALVVLSTSL